MAKRKDRMPWVSYSGPDPELSLSDDDWRDIEAAYGRGLDGATRDKINSICNAHLFDQRSENTAEPLALVQEYAKKAQKSAQPLWKTLVEGQGTGDAHLAYEAQFEHFIGQIGLPVSPHALAVRKDGDFLPYDGPALYLSLTPDIVQEVISLAMSAWIKIERGDGLTNPGFEEGAAFDRFLLNMRDFIRSKGWNVGPFLAGNEEASNLSKMLFALEGKFPPEVRSHPASAEALADKFRKAIRARNVALANEEE